jgi:heme-degrading monooxygenase HmoA
MTFQEDKVEAFLENFEKIKNKIRGFDGCEHLELWRDANDPHVFVTYSQWQSEEHLNAYRHSELFKGVWAYTKPLFAAKTSAFSVHKVEKV